jgi:nitroreductase
MIERQVFTMDAMTALYSRRSIRLYTPKPVPFPLVQDMLRAAMCAPSAGNERPWHFIVSNERAILDEIPKIHPFAAMLKQANTAIVVCGDTTLEKYKGYWPLDCAAATQNLLIAAHAKGFGAVWCGVYPSEDRVVNLKKLLSVPEHIVPFSLIPIGFPNEVKQAVERFDSSRVHENHW